ncbi:RnfABCDGE type electron transport complex subunit D, partial [Candidatus Bathyarchaeota archaeon]|nr:RnfABCDGE type electron transport complex subunit D [Candidatus Bathyarchaeota archaeon]
AIVTAAIWWPVSVNIWPAGTSTGWTLGQTLLVNCVIAVVVAVVLDALLALVMKDKGPLNTMSAAVFGMIVALCYSLGIPAMAMVEVLPLAAPEAFTYVAIISAVGLIVFKKLQGLLGRKYVNPAAAAKLLVFLPFLYTVLIPSDHVSYIPTLAAPLDYEGLASFASSVQSCYANPTLLMEGAVNLPPSPSDMFWTFLVAKYHGWPGGASSLAVIIVGLCLFIIARRYIKWRITLSYIVATAIMSLIMWGAYGGDPLLRLGFHLFLGSSIFLAFFMATDPATTPLTHKGQCIFGAGLAILTVLIQTYMNFLGGSILALIVMNLTTPILDKVGLQSPTETAIEKKRPKAKTFEAVKTYQCM